MDRYEIDDIKIANISVGVAAFCTQKYETNFLHFLKVTIQLFIVLIHIKIIIQLVGMKENNVKNMLDNTAYTTSHKVQQIHSIIDKNHSDLEDERQQQSSIHYHVIRNHKVDDRQQIDDQVGGAERGGSQNEEANGKSGDNKVEEAQLQFQAYKDIYLNFYKAVLIMSEILDPIQRDKLLNYSQQTTIQFMFLVWNRCYSYLKQCDKKQKEEGLKIPPNNELSNLNAYLQKAKSKFNIYNEMIDETRKKVGKVIGRLLKIKKSVEGKEKFLDGFEGLDYTAQQQVLFTYHNYVGIVLNNKEIKSQYFVNHRFKKILRGYNKICELSAETFHCQSQVKVAINQIIIDQ